MSVKRIFRWRCDDCGREAMEPDYGLPKGWIWETRGVLNVDQHTAHVCPDCQQGNKKKGG